MDISWEAIGVFLTILTAVVGIVWKARGLDKDIGSVKENLVEVEDRVNNRMKTIEAKQKAHDDIVVTMSKDVGYIRGAIDALMISIKGNQQQ